MNSVNELKSDPISAGSVGNVPDNLPPKAKAIIESLQHQGDTPASCHQSFSMVNVSALSSQWESFKAELQDIYEKTRHINWGKNAGEEMICKHFTDNLFLCFSIQLTHFFTDYIPQLAKADPSSYGIAVCSVTGDRHSIGDAKTDFCLQSVSKPLTYCIALDLLGEHEVHQVKLTPDRLSLTHQQHVGREPSGRGFNAYKLNKSGLPFNPSNCPGLKYSHVTLSVINSGAISTTALILPNLNTSDRFEYISEILQKAAARKCGFDNATYQVHLRRLNF